MSPGLVEDYISRLERELRRRGLQDPRILAEAREHLVDAVEEGRQRGLSVDEAEQEALERFGAPGIVAARMHEERDDMTGLAGAMTSVWQRKWWILVPTVAAAIVTGVASYYMLPTRYRADVKMIVVSPAPAGVTLVPRAADVERGIETLLGRTRLERIITDFGLYKEELQRAPMGEVVEQMRRDISITSLMQPSDGPPWPPRAVQAFSISFVAANPAQAKQVSERLATYLIDDNVKAEAERFHSTSNFLASQIQDVARQIREQEARLEGLRAANGGRWLSQADLLLYEVLKGQYSALSARRLDVGVAEAVEQRKNGRQLRILDAAQLPERPDGPGRERVTLIGTLIGLLIGLVLVGLRRSSNGAPPALAEA